MKSGEQSESSKMSEDMKNVEHMSYIGNLSANWERFKRKFKICLEAFYDEDIKFKKKLALFLYGMGDEGYEIYRSFTFKAGEAENFDKITEKFDAHFTPKTNITYERYIFFNRKQTPEESYEQYSINLKNLSNSCKFGTLREELIKDIFVSGIKSTDLKESLLKVSDLTIESALEICRARELAAQQIKEFKGEPSEVFYTKKDKSHMKNEKRRPCGRCLKFHEFSKCPAYRKFCNHCGGPNHFAEACKSKFTGERSSIFPRRGNRRVEMVENREEEDEDSTSGESSHNINCIKYVNGVTLPHKRHWHANLTINNKCINFKLDTGADCNIISTKDYAKLGFKLNKLNESNDSIITYTRERIPIMGICILDTVYKEKTYRIKFYVTNVYNSNILGLNACIKLNMIRKINNISSENFDDLFDEKIGCVNDTVKLELDKTIKPSIAPYRRIPFTLHNVLKMELDKLVKSKIIIPVTQPTEWVSNIVLIQKPNKSIRICLDPHNLNKAIKRSHYPFPTVDELSAKLKGAQCFAKLDANSGYWMIPLDKESSKLCTFQTPFGRYSFLRLPFGLNCAGEIFHRIISQSFEGLDGVLTFQDDILIHANNWEELDIRTKKVLRRAKDKGIKFNKDKCQFKMKEVTFLGHKFGEFGTKIDESKVEAVKNLRSPKTKKQLQRILGFFNYISKYIPNFSNLTGNLRELLKDDVKFMWNNQLEDDLNKLKEKVMTAPCLSYFDPKKKITLSVDSSSIGMGAVIIQEGKPIAFASKALNETQQRYAQVEKELLAVVYGCEKFKQFIYGNEIRIETDHKPLVSMCKKPLHKLTARIQRMMLKLQPFNFEITYVPGKYMYLADTLSRDFNEYKEDCSIDYRDLELQVNLLIDSLPIAEKNWVLITEEGKTDQFYGELKEFIIKGWPKYRKDIKD